MRAVFRLAWDKAKLDWVLYRTTSRGSQLIRRYRGMTKERSVQLARKYVSGLAPSQLVIRNKDGKIQSEATYEDDPRRYVG